MVFLEKVRDIRLVPGRSRSTCWLYLDQRSDVLTETVPGVADEGSV